MYDGKCYRCLQDTFPVACEQVLCLGKKKARKGKGKGWGGGGERKTLHSRTKENRLVIQFQKAVWRKVRPLFSRNKKLYSSKEVKENALASEGKSCRPETKTTVNRYVCHDLSV